MRKDKKRGIAVSGPWIPVPLDFLRSRACAELSPHAAKLLLDILGLLSTNASRNGDISITPKEMVSVRGWPGRNTLGSAVKELEEYGLLFKTKQGSRLDCNLFACTLYPLDCDLDKLDVRPGCYSLLEYSKNNRAMEKPATEDQPAKWRYARKSEKVAPPRNASNQKRSTTERTKAVKVA